MKKNFLVAVSAVVILLLVGSLLYYSIVTAQGPGDYDLWYDTNDDGKIDMKDIGAMARKFGASGTPLNKTALLLELEQNLTVLREEMIALQLWVGRTVVDMIYEVNVTLEARVPQRPIISIPAAAFIPEAANADNFAQVIGNQLRNWHAELIATFYAPVQLPHGVNITRVYSFWYDNSSRSVETALYKYNNTFSGLRIAYLESPLKGRPGVGSSNTNEILEPIIDNYSAYYLRVDIPPTHIFENWHDYRFYYAIIEFEYPE